jgi:ATP-dependent protease ClpP protease subunit
MKRYNSKGDYDKIKAEDLSPLAIKFQNAVREACKFKRSWRINRKKTFGADKALEYGMIDAIGSRDQAIQILHVK